MIGRRVVIGFDADGHPALLEDGLVAPARFGVSGGVYPVWDSASTPVRTVPTAAPMPSVGAAPLPGGVRVTLLQIPPREDREWHTFVTARFGELADRDRPGMHATPTVDVCAVLSGEVGLELDDGTELALGAGDVVVQHGVPHRWHNRGDVDAVVVVTLIGAALPGAGSP